MVEAVAECDDELMEKYLSGEELTERRDRSALRKATHRLKIFTRSSAAAPSRTRACSRMLDAVVDYLPSPLDVPPSRAGIDDLEVKIERKAATTSRSRRWSSRS
jgi:elongation factor G